MKRQRTVQQVLNGHSVTDGAGVQLRRYIGTPELNMFDPFLMLDIFGSDKPQDYIAGFPPHPHRGFETVTYMLEGKMRHKDSVGHEGVIETGGVQWMTAASGIIHSEMPEQTEGRLAGLQLWVNLPAKAKMSAPSYQEFDRTQIPVYDISDGVNVKLIAGEIETGKMGCVTTSYVQPLFMHVSLAKGTSFSQIIPSSYHVLIYVISGEVNLVDEPVVISAGQLAVLNDGEMINIRVEATTEIIVIAAEPLNEPVARGGPFVMNTRDEIEQAFSDYRQGTFIQSV
jgi:hypothetical protein